MSTLSRSMATTTAILLLCSLPLNGATQGPDLRLRDVQDLTVRTEIAGTGPYQEMNVEEHVGTLVYIPLRSWSPGHVEFWGEGLRVRLEVQPFEDVRDVKVRNDNARLDREPILGWGDGDAHSRLSRMEVVMDGTVVPIPVTAFTDLFDAPLCREGGQVLFAAAWRSKDGWRTYVQAQVGDDGHPLIVTWMLEDGRYRQRIVDRMY